MLFIRLVPPQQTTDSPSVQVNYLLQLSEFRIEGRTQRRTFGLPSLSSRMPRSPCFKFPIFRDHLGFSCGLKLKVLARSTLSLESIPLFDIARHDVENATYWSAGSPTNTTVPPPSKCFSWNGHANRQICSAKFLDLFEIRIYLRCIDSMRGAKPFGEI